MKWAHAQQKEIDIMKIKSSNNLFLQFLEFRQSSKGCQVWIIKNCTKFEVIFSQSSAQTFSSFLSFPSFSKWKEKQKKEEIKKSKNLRSISLWPREGYDNFSFRTQRHNTVERKGWEIMLRWRLLALVKSYMQKYKPTLTDPKLVPDPIPKDTSTPSFQWVDSKLLENAKAHLIYTVRTVEYEFQNMVHTHSNKPNLANWIFPRTHRFVPFRKKFTSNYEIWI